MRTDSGRQFEKKEVLYISYDGLLDPLGKAQIMPYIKGIAGSGIRYALVSFEKKNSLLSKENIQRFKEDFNRVSISWKILRYHKRPAVLSTLFDIFIGVLVSFKLVKNHSIRLLHARSYVAGLVSVIIKKSCKVKFIFDMRGFWADERVEADIWRKGGLLYRLAKCIEKILLQNADVIVVLTQAAKDEIRSFEYLQNRQTDIICIPTCVDLKRFSYRQPADLGIVKGLSGRFVAIYCGSISTWYLPQQMIDFFSLLKRDIPGAYLLVLSREKELFEKIARARGLKADSFSVLSLDYESVADYLALGRVGLAFYKPGYSRKGCCPTKIGEYLACGLPVVVNSGIGDCDKILGSERAGILINNFSDLEYEAAYKELQVLLGDEGLKNRCRLTAEKYFSLDSGVNRYKDIYNKLLDN
jgi:glycosyltransferase involved in cell wall biosynthesis